VANIKALVREHTFDGLAFLRSQDNYVVNGAIPDAEKPDEKRRFKPPKATLPPEFDRALDPKLPFVKFGWGRVMPAEVGFSAGFCSSRSKEQEMWLGTLLWHGRRRARYPPIVGAHRVVCGDWASATASGRNVTLVGRVVQEIGIVIINAAWNGGDGIFTTGLSNGRRSKQFGVAADAPESERTRLEVLRTDSPTFHALIDRDEIRREEWFHFSGGAY